MPTTLTRLFLCALLLSGSNFCFGQSRAAETLMRQAEELDRAGKLEAATATYQRAERAYNQANDYTGRQKAMTALAALSERQANELLSSVGAGDMTTSAAPSVAAQPAGSPAPAPAGPAAKTASPDAQRR